MPRLFVAVDLPDTATAVLADLRPPESPGVRPADPGRMHLTLHFLGEADPARTVDSLGAVVSPAFSLDLAGVGQFPSAGGAVTLWAGVRESPGLLALHAAVADALAGDGFRPEARRYAPHVTLARCEPGADAVVAGFLARHAGFALPGVRPAGFALYSSEFVGGVPVYRRERSFQLPSGG